MGKKKSKTEGQAEVVWGSMASEGARMLGGGPSTQLQVPGGIWCGYGSPMVAGPPKANWVAKGRPPAKSCWKTSMRLQGKGVQGRPRTRRKTQEQERKDHPKSRGEGRSPCCPLEVATFLAVAPVDICTVP